MAERPPLPIDPWQRIVGWPARAAALGGGIVLVGLAMLVTASVIRRWLTTEGIGGDFELVQMGLAVAVFAFLPLCLWRDGNIYVDTFTTWLPRRWQALLDAVWSLVYAAVAGLLAWGLAGGARDTASSGQTSMVLQLPVTPAIAVCSALAALLALVALASALRHGWRGEPVPDHTASLREGHGIDAG